ncbi:hypothetical protein DFR72_12015 [Lentzea flaviverrucosa]|uniref:Uncharacterized protein n=1 Tax=Lentzea flaviverrucosa TaxID=200379 RepID=A0A1H9K8H3_9PSEU|nr:hypothetical protein DFR72_12015 [Lentzea flaviverrucosa]SEQ95516.1 hypothetical protein SAMN05216195_103514 [Lentzea flaviverrucosa]
MGRHTLLRSILVAALAFGAVVATSATPATAETTITNSSTALAALAPWRRDAVRRTATSTDVSAELRAEALHALLNPRGDEAIDEYFATGRDKAMARALEREGNNLRYIQEINRYAPTASAVKFTSGKALTGSANAQDEYVQSGYQLALEADEATNNQHQEHLARLAGEDRAYVTYLATNDPGVQVRAAAKRALESGDDVQIGLFFKYYWGMGADVDRETFRRTTLHQNEIWHSKIYALTQAALAAEKAERESSGELARKARLDAIAYWDQIDQQSGQSSVDWNAEKGKADAQAAMWALVAQHARAAQGEQDWAAILERANSSNASWADEAAWAVAQAKFWQDTAAAAKKNADDARGRGDR